MFVTLEGLDGAGKSTQARLLAQKLTEEGRDVVTTREPGGTPLGEEVRRLLLGGPPMSAWTEAALFLAARAELVDQVIRPALRRGADVICDRYLDSSLVYQGAARGLGMERVLAFNLQAIGDCVPDRTFVLLVSPDEAEARAADEPDRIEREDAHFRAHIDHGYRLLARMFPERISTLDGTRDRDDLAKTIRDRLYQFS